MKCMEMNLPISRQICSVIWFVIFLSLHHAPTIYASAGDEEELTLVPPTQQGHPPAQSSDGSPALFDIYGPVPTSEPLPLLALGIAALIIALLLLIAYLYFRRSKDKLPPPVPPWDRALLDLAEAKTMRTQESGLEYLERASQILRNYIESRFAILSTKQTTREFLHSSELEHHQPLKKFRVELQGCLELADMAKFAHRIPEEPQLVMMEDAVTAFVMKTRPAEQDVEEVKKTGREEQP